MLKKVFLIILLIIIVSLAIFGAYLGRYGSLIYKKPEVSLNTITSSGQLGVLSAHVNILNSLLIGSSSDPDYINLYGQEAIAVYTVDLEKAEISRGENSKGEKIIFIRLPEPYVQLYVDERTTNNIAEYQKRNWTGNAEDGYRAYSNQTASGYREMLDSLQESDGLMLEAKKNAISRVSELIGALTLDGVRCEVYFSETN